MSHFCFCHSISQYQMLIYKWMPPLCKHSGMYILRAQEVASKKVCFLYACSPHSASLSCAVYSDIFCCFPTPTWTSQYTVSMVLVHLTSFLWYRCGLFSVLISDHMSIPGITFNPLESTIILAPYAFRTLICTFPHLLTLHFYLWWQL